MTVRRPFEKYLDAGLKRWMLQTAKKNYWRVHSFYDLDDLIADGYLAFAITKSRYSHRVENKAHFMALFKRVYLSMIIDMANARTRKELRGASEIAVSQITEPGHELDMIEILAGEEAPDTELEVSLAHASAEVRQLIFDMKEGYFAGRKPQKKRNGRRESQNEWFNRMLGTKGIDFEGQLRELLMPA